MHHTGIKYKYNACNNININSFNSNTCNSNSYCLQKSQNFLADKHIILTNKLHLLEHILIKHINNIDFLNNSNNNIIFNSSETIKTYVLISLTEEMLLDDIIFDIISDNHIINLLNQTIKPHNILIYISKSLTNTNIDSKISYLKKKFPSIICIINTDENKTNIIGLLELDNEKKFISDNDLIIILNTEMLFTNIMIASYLMCYQLYNCDIIATNENIIIKSLEPFILNDSDIFYLDNYNGKVSSRTSFSIRYKVIKNKYKIFYDQIIEKFPNIKNNINSDDLIFNIFMNENKLYAVENRFHILSGIGIKLDEPKVNETKVNETKVNETKVNETKVNETEINKYYNIRIINNEYIRTINYVIQKSIPKRNFNLISELNLLTCPDDIHVIFTYLNEHMILLTITIFNTNLVGTYIKLDFNIDKHKYSIITIMKSDTSNINNKYSYIININNQVIYPKLYFNPITFNSNDPLNMTIMQTNISSSLSQNRFNSIMTILNNAPEFSYEFYDDDDLINYIKQNYADIVYDSINNLIPGAYKSDLFRYCYLLINGGIYMDCKKVFYEPLSDYINNFINFSSLESLDSFDIYVKDIPKNYAYNSIIVCNKFSKVIELALKYSIFNICNNMYKSNPLSITGPGCLGNVIDYIYNKSYPYYYFNIVPQNKSDAESFIHNNITNEFYKIPLIKNTYLGYYDENYYLLNHYHNLWHEHNIYKKDLSILYPMIRQFSDIILFKNKI